MARPRHRRAPRFRLPAARVGPLLSAIDLGWGRARVHRLERSEGRRPHLPRLARGSSRRPSTPRRSTGSCSWSCSSPSSSRARSSPRSPGVSACRSTRPRHRRRPLSRRKSRDRISGRAGPRSASPRAEAAAPCAAPGASRTAPPRRGRGRRCRPGRRASRPHRPASAVRHRRVERLRRDARFVEHAHAVVQQRNEDAVDDEARRVVAADGDLAPAARPSRAPSPPHRRTRAPRPRPRPAASGGPG